MSLAVVVLVGVVLGLVLAGWIGHLYARLRNTRDPTDVIPSLKGGPGTWREAVDRLAEPAPLSGVARETFLRRARGGSASSERGPPGLSCRAGPWGSSGSGSQP